MSRDREENERPGEDRSGGTGDGGTGDGRAGDGGEGMPRSRFLNLLLGTGAGGLAAAVLYPVSAYVVPPESPESSASSVELSVSPDDIAPNSGRIFKFGSEPGILIRTPGGELRAFSAVCTHLECTVQYREDLTHIWCACHNGHFDLHGRNIAGPPPAPLEEYDVFTRSDRVVVSRRS
ncbi:MAG: ubiquinol-cytochrome c reductase iron-sulfur subunit [Candidatus Longimicrobiales bacterium M2_2A_002]